MKDSSHRSSAWSPKHQHARVPASAFGELPEVTPQNRGQHLLWFATLVVLAACSATPQDAGWERHDDHSPPTMADSSDCRFQARRHAELRYPNQPREQAGRSPRYDDDRRFPAEIGFYQDCMRQKGFVRAAAAST
jgi:hypothetical protein